MTICYINNVVNILKSQENAIANIKLPIVQVLIVFKFMNDWFSEYITWFKKQNNN